MRLVDVILSFPILLLALALLSVAHPSVITIVVLVGISFGAYLARIVFNQAVTLRERDFVLAARTAGVRMPAILVRHILPHVLPSVLVVVTLGIATAIQFEATLSYVGIGVQPPAASWGRMISDGQGYIGSAPRLVALPGLAIVAATFGFSLLGDALRDVLDPALDAQAPVPRSRRGALDAVLRRPARPLERSSSSSASSRSRSASPSCRRSIRRGSTLGLGRRSRSSPPTGTSSGSTGRSTCSTGATSTASRTADLGTSIFDEASVVSNLKQRAPRTAELAVAAAFLQALIGIPLGVLAAFKRGLAHRPRDPRRLAAGPRHALVRARLPAPLLLRVQAPISSPSGAPARSARSCCPRSRWR